MHRPGPSVPALPLVVLLAVTAVLLPVVVGGAASGVVGTVDPVERPVPDGEWTQVGYDAQNTNRAPDAFGPRRDLGVTSFVGVRSPGRDLAVGGPVVVDGTLYHLVQNQSSGRASLVAVDLSGEEVRWRVPVGDEVLEVSPTYADGRLFVPVVANGSESLVAVDTETGAVSWRYTVREEAASTTNAFVASVAAVDGTVFAGTIGGGAGGSQLHAVTTDGERRWVTSLDTQVAARPAVADGRVYVAGQGGGSTQPDSTVYALGFADGAVHWQQAVPRLPSAVAGPMVVAGRVVLTNRSHLVALDAAAGEVAWRRAGLASGLSLVGGGDHVYTLAESDGPADPRLDLAAVDVATGETAWRVEVPVERFGRLSAASDTVYVSKRDRTVAVSVSDRAVTGQIPYGDDEPAAVVDGHVYWALGGALGVGRGGALDPFDVEGWEPPEVSHEHGHAARATETRTDGGPGSSTPVTRGPPQESTTSPGTASTAVDGVGFGVVTVAVALGVLFYRHRPRR